MTCTILNASSWQQPGWIPFHGCAPSSAGGTASTGRLGGVPLLPTPSAKAATAASFGFCRRAKFQPSTTSVTKCVLETER